MPGAGVCLAHDSRAVQTHRAMVSTAYRFAWERAERDTLGLEPETLGQLDITSLLEALLFVADGPTSLDDLAKALNLEASKVRAALEALVEDCSRRGVRVVRSGARIQLVSAPGAASYVERFLGIDHSSVLSSAALETLAIIAYQQPITRARIEAIRGVNSDSVIRTLMAKMLIDRVGRLDQAGRPLLYGTTFEFLQYFGIKSLEELPSLPELEDLSVKERTTQAEGEADHQS